MARNKIKQPDIVQAVDFWTDREYYKIVSGFLFSSNILVRSDRLEGWKEWHITCEELPNKIIINGKEYQFLDVLTPNNTKR